MPLPSTFVPARSAVLSMDYQSGVVSIYVKDPQLMDRAGRLLTHLRRIGMLVVHVKVGFRPGVPEISPRNQLLGAIKASSKHQQLFQGAAGAIHPAVAPAEGDVVITKSRVNAFAGTDLDVVLRAREIDSLVLMGVATSGVVLSTLLHAADADYRLLVVKDCCADVDQDLHAVLVDRLFSRLAAVVSAAELLNE